MVYARIGITAHDDYWLDAAVRSFTGYGTSVIGCDAEVGLERLVSPNCSPDGRPGAVCMVFGFSSSGLEKAIVNRVGQCLLTCPSTFVFDGALLDHSNAGFVTHGERLDSIGVGRVLRYFGDGFQKSKMIEGQRYWRIPVMEGEFVLPEMVQVFKGVAGGNLLIEAENVSSGLNSLRRAIDCIRALGGNTILPFPGGAVRSGSKVGSQYKALRASTSHEFCPTLRGRVFSQVHSDANCVYEIVIDGVDEASVAAAMKNGIEAAAGPGIPAIGAGNYGGKLGKFHFHLHDLFRPTCE